MNPTYIRKQVQQFLAAGSQQVADDCLYRIASHCDLIPPRITSAYQMTTAQNRMVLNWLERNGYLTAVK